MINEKRFGIPEKSVGKICGIFAQHPEIDRVILYGSRAKGNFKPGSDIDLTLVGEKIGLDLLFQVDSEIDDLLLPWVIDLSIYFQIKNQDLINHIDRVGQLFYRRNIDKT
jgi:predicted nucleotidyltransferase